MQSNMKTDAATRSWLAFLAAALAVCVSFALLGLASGAALAAPEAPASSSASSADKATEATSAKASDEDNAAVEKAAEELENASTTSFAVGNDLFVGAEEYHGTGDVAKANLFAGGRTVELENAVVGADAFVAGETINVAGMKASNNLFIAGNNVTVSGTQGKAVFAVGNNLDLAADADSLQAAGRTVFLKGTFEGDVDISAQTVVIDPYIVVNGTLNVEAEQEPTIASTAKIGSFNFNQAEYNDGTNIASGFANIGSAAWVESLVKTLIAMLLAGIIMLLFLRTETVDASGRLVRNRPVAILVTGLLSLILIPAIIVGLFIARVGWPIAFTLCAIATVATVLSVAYAAIALGRAALPRVNKWITSILFLAIFALLMCLPVVDFIVAVLCIVFTVGSFVQGWWVWRRNKAPKAPEPGDADMGGFTVPRGVNYAEEQPVARPLTPSNIQQTAETDFPIEPDEPRA